MNCLADNATGAAARPHMFMATFGLTYFHADGEHQHDDDRQGQGEKCRYAVLTQADQGERGEHHHDVLREIEHTRSFENKDKTEGDQRIKGA